MQGEGAHRVSYHAASGYGADNGRACLGTGIWLLCFCRLVASSRQLLLAEGNGAREYDVDSVRNVTWHAGCLRRRDG
jgi:hypothetical protein